MAAPRSMHFSDKFVISCGTVTLDRRGRKVLVISEREHGGYMLPKGRKDIGESLEMAALRETFEETGFTCQLLSHAFPTLATGRRFVGVVVDESGLSSSSTVEPFAVTQRTTDGILKIIFWYLAEGDSSAAKVQGTQMEDEDFDSEWVDEAEVLGKLTFEDDRAIAAKAIECCKD